ncbi:Y-family DNA polymerase [Pseudomonas eucalypticola]|uniref:DNA polymerase Y family protein n=1 Tax=Pseudomonas eucalypticola TaxID=2599595 RepID=A0A7D5D760_9PSED|nr:DNA polymerase Y family protein [Pseudomonas eucalypticola]QKZ05114.1 DNA polymerase Y family protein [Pseudomonas eucalypticola]
MLWACILFPQLALDSARRRREDPDAPLALISGPAQRRVLQAVNPAAKALGLRPGQTLTAAHALSRAFATLAHDPADIDQCQQFLAAWAYRFSSQVSLHYPRALLLEVQSSLGLFGPWPTFEARLREELKALGFSHRITLATNPVAARMLANVHDGLAVLETTALPAALAPLPIERLGLPRDTATAFARMGLRSFGQVRALPRDTLARRFAASDLQHLDTLDGLRPQALAFYTPPDFFEQRIELNFDVESHQALLFPLRRLINDLAAYLGGRDSGVQRFTLHLEHAEGEDTLVPVGLLGAERDPGMLFELARGRLEPVQVKRPVRNVRLVARDLPRFVPSHQALFDARPQQSQAWEQVRERLRARLGDDAVSGLAARADHRPERAWVPQALPKAMAVGECPARPGWLLAEPQAWTDCDIRVLAGPERIESGWWDGGDVRRDYYLVETASGQRAWAYEAVGEQGRLWLQGWFA